MTKFLNISTDKTLGGENSSDVQVSSQKAVKDYITNALATKQDELTAASELDYTGTTLSLLDGQSEVLSSVTIKSTPDLDNNTINLNDQSQLQAVGSILQSGGYQKYWKGTKAQFNAISEKDSNTLYEVLDDEEHALFEVDGTSIEFNDDNILQVPNNIDFVVQEQTWGSGESGYRMYRKGYLEQWGKVSSSTNGEVEFTMHTAFKDMTYSIFAQVSELGNYFVSCYGSGPQKFKVRVQSSSGYNMAVRVCWRAYGYYK